MIQFAYEKLGNLCYNCGLLGHLKNTCSLPQTSNPKGGDMYGVWLKAEAKAYSVINEGSYLRKVKNPKTNYFDSFIKEDLGQEEDE